ncbi:MAG: ATP-binding protein [Cyclobacteriaceae bacterium]|nr:ATP-binding protein [Cyclobacteriaceae bacterium]
MTIKTRLIGGHTAISILVGVIGFLSYLGMKEISVRYNQVINHSSKEIAALENIKFQSFRMQTGAFKNDIIVGDSSIDYEEKYLKEFVNAKNELRKWEAEFEKFADDNERKKIHEIKKAHIDIERLCESLIKLKQRGVAGEAIIELKNRIEKFEEEFLIIINKVIEEELEELEEENENTNMIIDDYITIIIFSVLGIILLGLLIRTLVLSKITSSLSKLNATAIAFGEGKLDHKAEVISNDEIGSLATTFNVMAENLAKSTISKEYLDDILKSLVEILIVTDSKGTIILHNETANKLLNITNGSTLKDVSLSSNSDFVQLFNEGNIIKLINAPTDSHIIETQITTPDGNKIPLEVSISSIKNKNEIIILARNISERKQAAITQDRLMIQLKNVNQELRELVYIISHDLKVPLRGIGMVAEWLVKDASDKLDENNTNNLLLIQKRVRRMYGLLEGILQYSKIENLRIDKSTIDLNLVIKEIIKTLNIESEDKISIDEALPIIKANHAHMNLIFQNLISNAITHKGNNTAMVHIGVKDTDTHWEFYVKDNGIGIEQKHFDRIFKIFQTLANKDDVENSGIGLTLVKKIVELYNGRVWVDSVMGQGATFYFTIKK